MLNVKVKVKAFTQYAQRSRNPMEGYAKYKQNWFCCFSMKHSLAGWLTGCLWNVCHIGNLR